MKTDVDLSLIKRILTLLFALFLIFTINISKADAPNFGVPVASIVAEHEQYRMHAYKPTKNDRPTAGFGLTFYDVNKAVEMGDIITLHTAVDALYEHLRGISRQVYDLSPTVNNCELAALTIFVYNVGTNNYKNSTMRKLIDTNKHRQAAEEFLKWNKQKGTVLAGLTKRRQMERKLFLSPNAPICDY